MAEICTWEFIMNDNYERVKANAQKKRSDIRNDWWYQRRKHEKYMNDMRDEKIMAGVTRAQKKTGDIREI